MRSWIWVNLLLAPTTAFYPYKPVEHQVDDSRTLSVSERRSPYGRHVSHDAREHRGYAKLTMKRKAPPRGSHPYSWSIAETTAMARRSQSHSSARSSTPIKRENEYSIVTAAQPSQTNSIAVDEDGTDFSYFSTLRFGSGNKVMYMLIDTGAANTWVMGSNCTSHVCEKHNTFGDEDSDSLKVTTSTFNLTYGTGSVSGMTVNDTVDIAGIPVPLSFGAASVTSDDFLTYPMDGILGLGRSASNTMEYPTAMEAVEATGTFQSTILGVHLQRASDGSTDGELNFGAPDSTKYTGEILYTKTVADGAMWEIPIDDARFDGNPCNFRGKSAIVDTGTSFTLLPPEDARKVHAQIPNSKQDGETFNIPCYTDAPIQIVISGVAFNISTADYIGNPVDGGDLCASNIIGRQAFGSSQWLLGDVFLKNVYTVFDFDENRIGFGAKHESATTSPSSAAPTKTSTPTGSNAPTASPTILPPEGQTSSSARTPAGTAATAAASSSKSENAAPPTYIPTFASLVFYMALFCHVLLR